MTHCTRLCTLVLAASAGSALAAPVWSNTLGVPGFSGSYVASFTPFDDGTGESLYACGSFSTVGVPGGTNIARWTGSAWAAVGGGLQNQYANAMAVFQGDLIVAGYFDTAGSVPGTAKLARWDGTTWNSMGAVSESFLNSMWDLQVFDDGSGEQLYVAGNYLDLAGNPDLDHIARWDGTTYTAVGGTISGAVPLIVLDLQVADLGSGPELYAAGRFLNIGGTPANNIAKWNGASWEALGTGITNSSIAQVICMTTFDDGSGPALYAGGSFNAAGGTPAIRVARWDGTTWAAMGDGLSSTVQELVVYDDGDGAALYALGNFSASGSTPIGRVARWTGTAWVDAGAAADGNVFGGIVYDLGNGPAMHIGGGFANIDGQPAARVASLQPPEPCLPDLAEPFGTLDFFDISAFLSAFNNQEPAADFAEPLGEWNFFDVSAFLGLYGAGCP